MQDNDKTVTDSEVPELKIEFAPGCFDHFNGTQEELDELMAEIHRMVESGEIFENSHAIDLDDLEADGDLSPEEIENLTAILNQSARDRKLN